MRFLPRHIAAQLMVATTLLVVATIASFGWITSWRQNALYGEIYRRERLVITRDLAIAATHHLVLEDYAGLDVLTQRAAGLPDVLEAWVAEKDGRVVSNFVQRDGVAVPSSYAATKILQNPPGTEPYVVIAGGVMTIWQPVEAGVLLGWVKVDYSLAEIARMRQVLWHNAMVMGLVWIGVSLLLFFLLFRKPLTEIRKITGFAGRLHERVGEQLAVNSGSAEIEALGDSLNFASRELNRSKELLLAEQERLRLDEERFEALFKLSQMYEASERQIAGFALEECVKLTGSTVGYLHFIHEDQKNITLTLWSQGAMQECTAEKSVPHYPLDKAGVWADCARQRRPVIHNDYPNLPDRKGYPAGHFPVLRHMSIPIMEGDKVVAVAGVGNKAAPYGEEDVRQLYLFMNDMWGLLSRKRREEFIRGTLDSLGEGLIVVNRDYKIISANRAYSESLGLPLDAVIGQRCHEVSHHLDNPCFLAANGCDCAVQQVFATGEPATVTHRHEKANGEVAWMDTRAFPLRNEAGEVVAAIEVVNDVTERRRLEGQLRQSQKMEAIGTLAGGIAHDFNNILSALLGYAELARMDVPGNHPVAGYVAEILRAGERARGVVKQILTFSRKAERDLKPLKAHLIVKEALKLLRASIPTNVEIHQEIAPDCGSVLADPSQIHQIVMNLCTNAFQAMQGGSGTISIRMQNIDLDADAAAGYVDLAPGPYLRLEVSDNGCGIDHAIIERIFDPYFTTKEKGKGTGLGLSMVLGIVRGYGGHVSVYSEPGLGTTFRVYFPRLVAEETVAAPASERAELPGGSERVVLVDDEAAIVETAGAVLERLGYRVTTFGNGQEALDYLKKQPAAVDLLITDMSMPKMTGLELLEEVRRLRGDLPVILCSGYSEALTQEKLKSLAVAAFLMKPIGMHDLAFGVRRALDRRPA